MIVNEALAIIVGCLGVIGLLLTLCRSQYVRLVFVLCMAGTLAMLYRAHAADAPIAGSATVIDGDTLDVGGTRVRLWGVDAPESAQKCLSGDGEVYPCGADAKAVLAARVAGQRVTCAQKDIDIYGRVVAVCRIEGYDLGGWMVAEGYAVAYRANHTYKAREAVARRRRLGMHGGTFVEPFMWRRGVR